MKCSNQKCDNEFTSKASNQLYCCFICRKRQYYKNNIERLREYNRLNASKPENYLKARQRQINYVKKNKEYVLQRSRYYELTHNRNHSDRAKLNRIKNPQTNKNYAKKYYKENSKYLKLYSRLFKRYGSCIKLTEIKKDFQKYQEMCL